MNLKVPAILLVLLLALMAAQGITFYPRMPEQMATQIDREGNARSWMGRDEFMIVYSGMAAFLGAIFLLVPLSSNKAPAAWTRGNPDSSSPRPGRTMAVVKVAVMWAGVGTLSFILGIGHLTFRANIGERAQFREHADLILIGYGIFMAAWVVLFLLALRSEGDSPRICR
jgi:uncharacterized membrane protein